MDRPHQRAHADHYAANQQKVVLSSVYFLPAEYANNHVEKVHTCTEHYTKCRENTTIIAAELGPGSGAEHLSVAPYTLNGSNKRGDRLKDWPMIQIFSRSTQSSKKGLDKQATFCSAGGKDMHLDYELVDRRSMRHCRDAEANDMIDMGCDTTAFVTHFTFPGSKTSDSQN